MHQGPLPWSHDSQMSESLGGAKQMNELSLEMSHAEPVPQGSLVTGLHSNRPIAVFVFVVLLLVVVVMPVPVLALPVPVLGVLVVVALPPLPDSLVLDVPQPAHTNTTKEPSTTPFRSTLYMLSIPAKPSGASIATHGLLYVEAPEGSKIF